MAKAPTTSPMVVHHECIDNLSFRGRIDDAADGVGRTSAERPFV
jgi:hypothetical protein